MSYTDDMVATQLVAGLYNSDHQVKVLSESTTLKTLDQKVKRLMVLEKSDTSLSSLSNSDAFSNYTGGSYHKGPGGENSNSRREKWSKKDNDAGRKKNSDGGTGIKCTDCGKKHPKCKFCDGFHKCTTRCNFCKKMGHIKNCCMKLQSAVEAQVEAEGRRQEEDAEEEVVFAYKVSVQDSPLPRQNATHRKMQFHLLLERLFMFTPTSSRHTCCHIWNTRTVRSKCRSQRKHL